MHKTGDYMHKIELRLRAPAIMTLSDFRSKTGATAQDAIAALKVSSAEEIKEYIRRFPKHFTALLTGLRSVSDRFSREQLAEIIQAIYLRRDFMYILSLAGYRLAKAVGCERMLEERMRQHWENVTSNQSFSFIVGMSRVVPIRSRLPLLAELFELNANNNVRCAIVSVLYHDAPRSVPAKKMLYGFVDRMPDDPEKYARPGYFELIHEVKLVQSGLSRRELKQELKARMRQQWNSITPAQAYNFFVNLSHYGPIWSAPRLLTELFELNPNNDVRATIVSQLHGDPSRSVPAEKLLRRFLDRMPNDPGSYSEPHSLERIQEAKHACSGPLPGKGAKQ